MSTHLQVDATPTVAAKTLRRTRKKNGSQIDLSVVSYLAHFSLKTPQRVINEQCKPRSDQGLFALNTGISVKHSNHKN